MRCIIIALAFATLTACGAHVALAPQRQSEPRIASEPILPMASPDGPVMSSGGHE